MKFYKIIGIISIVVFSFYLTDFATELAINSNPLMQTIKDSSDNYQVSSVNATIKDNTIIPGIKGKKVNTMESFLNMKDFGSFNINYLVYDSVVPSITLKNSNVVSSINMVEKGSIILIDNNLSLDNFKIFLKSIKSKDLKIVYLSEIIKE